MSRPRLTVLVALSAFTCAGAAESYDAAVLSQLSRQLRDVHSTSTNTKRFTRLNNLKRLIAVPMAATSTALGPPDSVRDLAADEKSPHMIVWTYGLGKYEAAERPVPGSDLNDVVISNGPDFPEVMFFFADDTRALNVICGRFPH